MALIRKLHTNWNYTAWPVTMPIYGYKTYSMKITWNQVESHYQTITYLKIKLHLMG